MRRASCSVEEREERENEVLAAAGSDGDGDGDDNTSDGDDDGDDNDGDGSVGDGEGEEDDGDEQRSDDDGDSAEAAPRRKRGKKVKPTLTPAELAKFQQRLEQTGIVYLSRVPPYMQPPKIRHLLSKYGEIGRVYLAPESAAVRDKRKRFGGSRKEKFVEGWVEYMNKKDAKRAAAILNNHTIGGKTTGFYHDDIWTLKYLPRFKWHHLTERIALEKASREQKLRAELARSKRENEYYLQNVDKAKMIQSIEERKRAARSAGASSLLEDPQLPDQPMLKRKHMEGDGTDGDFEELRRRFKQRKPVQKQAIEPEPTVKAKLFTTMSTSS